MGHRGSALAALFVGLLGACATPGAPKAHFSEDAYARYYVTETGRTLRVEKDGTVLDITCLPIEVAEGRSRRELPQGMCPDAKIPVLGQVALVGKDWDMSAYPLEGETGRCRPLFTLKHEEDVQRHSCWNRLWEVPAAVVVYPVGIAVVLGAATSGIWVPLLFF